MNTSVHKMMNKMSPARPPIVQRRALVCRLFRCALLYNSSRHKPPSSVGSQSRHKPPSLFASASRQKPPSRLFTAQPIRLPGKRRPPAVCLRSFRENLPAQNAVRFRSAGLSPCCCFGPTPRGGVPPLRSHTRAWVIPPYRFAVPALPSGLSLSLAASGRYFLQATQFFFSE